MNNNNQINLMVGLVAQTSIHAGAGSAVGAVDLPIQREGHNGWPCIFGSAVKGALRTKAEQYFSDLDQEDSSNKGDQTIKTIFGPSASASGQTESPADHAGAISVGDARLLLLPVRSLTSAFRWVTCPAALDRLKRDAQMLGKEMQFKTPVVPREAGTEIALCRSGEYLFLEEYRFSVSTNVDLGEIISAVCELVSHEGFKHMLEEQLVVVSNDMFAHLARSATPVNAHIRIEDDGSKTVAKGALWYEETLPPETVLYTPIMVQKSRNKDNPICATAIGGLVNSVLTDHPWLQLGGNETVGMGWCGVCVVSAEKVCAESTGG